MRTRSSTIGSRRPRRSPGISITTRPPSPRRSSRGAGAALDPRPRPTGQCRRLRRTGTGPGRAVRPGRGLRRRAADRRQPPGGVRRPSWGDDAGRRLPSRGRDRWSVARGGPAVGRLSLERVTCSDVGTRSRNVPRVVRLSFGGRFALDAPAAPAELQQRSGALPAEKGTERVVESRSWLPRIFQPGPRLALALA